jgi:hypothetical protein
MAEAARPRIDGQDLLSVEPILLQVLAFVGRGDWFFIAQVCKQWQLQYQKPNPGPRPPARPVTDRTVTFYQNAFVSTTRAALAARACSASTAFQFATGKLASVACLQAAQAEGLALTDDVCTGAAQAGARIVLEWLATQRELPDNVGTFAVIRGDVELLEWLQQRGVKFGPRSCEEAARRGHLAALTHLRKQQCAWDSRTPDAAARNGHLSTLEWGWQNGCPASVMTEHAAAASGNTDMLAWVRANNLH